MRKQTDLKIGKKRYHYRRRHMKACFLLAALFSIGMVIFSLGKTDATTLETRLSQGFGLGDLMAFAYENNPTIVAAREAWRETVERYRLETSYPDPELMVTYFPDPIETRLGPQDWNATLSQKIPFPGKLSKAGEVVETEAKIAKLNLDKTVRDITVSIRESFYELLYIRRAQTAADQNMKLLDHLRTVGETAYAQDRNTLLDMIKAQSQSGQLRYDILLLKDLEETETTRLNTLLNRAPGAHFGALHPPAAAEVVFTLEEIYRMAKDRQEEIQIAGVRVERAQKKMELAKLKNLPDFKVGLFYAGIGNPDVANPPPDEGQDALGIQAGVNIPLWFGKNKSRILKAKAAIKKAEAAKTAQVNTTFANIRSLYFKLTNARRLMDLYSKELLPQAAKSIEMAETWFQEKQSSFSDFVETQSVWYNFQLAFARATADHGKYLARLEGITGQSITMRTKARVENGEKEEK